MPTGYTAELYDGEQSFKDFVLRTARGMMPLIHMRDHSLDAPVTLPEVSDYHRRRLAEAQDALAAFEAYSDEDWEAARDAEHEEAMRYWTESQEGVSARRARYETMVDKVWAWTAPTKEHSTFKTYMLNQLNESIKYDCSTYPKPELRPVEQYKEDKISKALRDVSYHSEEHSKEIERVQERRAWIQALLDSLDEG